MECTSRSQAICSTTDDDLHSKNIRPGLIEPLLNAMVEMNEGGSHKLRVDGKKINASTATKLGQVDMFGFEDGPTVKDREDGRTRT